MELKKGRKKPRIELRYYTVPEGEPTLVLMGTEWVRTYGTEEEDLHFHNLMEIGLCHWGTGTMILEEEEIPYRDGDVTLIPSNCLHTTLSNDMNFWEYLFFDPQEVLQRSFPDNPLFVENLVKRLSGEAKCLTAESPEGKHLGQLVTMILDEYQQKEQAYRVSSVQSLLTVLLLHAARLYKEQEQEIPRNITGLRQIMPAIEYIAKNYMNNISIQDVASQCLMSEVHLRRRFKECLRMSPGEQLTMVRVQNACDLLNSTDYTMPEVALRVGYQSISSFERNFQKLVGMTPYQYKKRSGDYKGRLREFNISAKKGWVSREDD